jgi:hypothetical protein
VWQIKSVLFQILETFSGYQREIIDISFEATIIRGELP